MVSNRRLLILSCSQRKRCEPGLLPAIERYDGPPFRVLRRFLRERPGEAEHLRIHILSAAYGLIPSKYPIACYDQMMTQQRAAELCDKAAGTFENLLRDYNYSALCLAMSKTYLATLEGWATSEPQGMQVTLVNGSQGARLTKLKRWLWESVEDNAKDDLQDANSRGYACIRGIEVTMTSEQVFDIARRALAESLGAPDRYYTWYVQVGDRQVAPKWLVSQLTGLPVSAFVTSEARRFLIQLGIKVKYV